MGETNSTATINVNVNGLDQAKTQIDGATASTTKLTEGLSHGGVRAIGIFARGLGEAAAAGTLLFGGTEESAKKMQKSLNDALGIVFAVQGVMHAASVAEAAWTTVKGLFVTKTIVETVALEGETAAQVGLNVAMEANPIGIVIAGAALLAITIAALYNYTHQLNGEQENSINVEKLYAEQVKMSNGLIEKSNEEYKKEILNSTLLFGTLESENVSKSERVTLIKEINKEFGQYLPNLLTEKSSLEDIYTAQSNVNNALEKNLEADVSKDRAKSLIETKQGLKDLNTGYGAYIYSLQHARTEMLKSDDVNEAQLSEIEKTDTVLKTAMKGYDNTKHAIEGYQAAIDANNKKLVTQETLIKEQIGDISKLTPITYDHTQALKDENTTYEDLVKKIDEYTSALAKAPSQQDKNALQTKIDKLKEEKDLYDEIAVAQKNTTNAPAPLPTAIPTSFKEDKDYAAEKLTLTKGLNGQLVDADAATLKTMRSNAISGYKEQIKEEYELDKESEKKKKELEKELANAAIDMAKGVADTIFNIKSIKENEALNQAEHTLDLRRTKELSNVNLTQQQITAINKKYDAQDLKLRQQAAIDKKKVDKGQALAEGALAVIKDFATAPNYIVGIIEAALTAAATAEQIATINAQPIPTYATGGLIGGSGGPTADNHLIAASSGEYILNAAATSKNYALIDSMNKGMDMEAIVDRMVKKISSIPVINVATDTAKVNTRVNKVRNVAYLK